MVKNEIGAVGGVGHLNKTSDWWSWLCGMEIGNIRRFFCFLFSSLAPSMTYCFRV